MNDIIKCEKNVLVHGGNLGYYTHESIKTATTMRFTMFTPPKENNTGSLIIYLSGLSCTEENFTTKAGAYKKAAELGLNILVPDTSPRGEDVPDSEGYDLGQGAGFYLDATQEPWVKNFQMESYIIEDLIPQCENAFDLRKGQCSITGHSMGGHGALVLYFKYPKLFKSCSAFAPIIAPSIVPWGQKAFEAYLGDNKQYWELYDACYLVKKIENAKENAPILIDQGLDDFFLDDQLQPELFEEACKQSGQKLNLRLQAGYDHSYFFIQSFIEDHLTWHNKYLLA